MDLTGALHYDAHWGDGRIEHGVNPVMYMYDGAPSDCIVVKTVIDDSCPTVKTRPWVEYLSGTVLPGPSTHVC